MSMSTNNGPFVLSKYIKDFRLNAFGVINTTVDMSDNRSGTTFVWVDKPVLMLPHTAHSRSVAQRCWRVRRVGSENVTVPF